MEELPYKNDWDGKFKGQDLPPGTYFYVLQPDPDTSETVQGYFNIVR